MTFFISLLKLRRRLTSVDILLAYIANLLYRIHCTPRNVCPTRDAIYCLTRRKAADRLGRVALLTSIGIGISQTSKSYVCATRRSTQHPCQRKEPQTAEAAVCATGSALLAGCYARAWTTRSWFACPVARVARWSRHGRDRRSDWAPGLPARGGEFE